MGKRGCFIDRALLGVGLPRNTVAGDDCPCEGCEGVIGFDKAELKCGLVVACSENPNDHWRLPTLEEEMKAKITAIR